MKNRQFSPGVLAKDQLETLIKDECLTSSSFPTPEVGPSAIDLRLGKKAWKLRHGQRLTTRELSKIQAQSDLITPKSDNHGDYFEFDSRSIYLVELDHVLDLPSSISGRATGKSSIGRLDVITRLVTLNSREYDLVEPGLSGQLHLLIMPQTFSIRVEPGGSMNQLRLFSGPQCSAAISSDLVPHYGTPFWYTKEETHFEPWPKGENSTERRLTADPLLFDLTVDLGDPDYQHVFKAKRQPPGVVDIRKTYLKSQGNYDPTGYFDAVKIDKADGSVVLNDQSFYIMKSRERLAIPNDVAVEVIAISERIGDIRIHYAGFAHPGFGRTGNSKHRGTPLIFEVRATDMETKLYDKSILARVQLFRMSKATEPENSDYEGQELKLSKVFNEWQTV